MLHLIAFFLVGVNYFTAETRYFNLPLFYSFRRITWLRSGVHQPIGYRSALHHHCGSSGHEQMGYLPRALFQRLFRDFPQLLAVP